MSRALTTRRTIAASAAFVVAAWGATALPAAALEPGNGQGQGQSKHEDKADKGNKGNKGGQSEQGQSQGNKGGQSEQGQSQGNKGGQSEQGQSQGNKGGNGPKPGKGPQGPKGDHGDPAGNNGTVKITPIGQDDGIPQNNPHVPCGFDIEWYGFDEGDDIISSVTLAMHAPTKDVVLTPGGPSEVFVGGDPATGAGTDTGFDGEATYYPTFDGEPHAQQGYHIKLTIHTPGSQGADTKHKVFWVEPCETEVEGEEETPAGETPDEGQDDTEVLGEQATSSDSDETDDTEVLGAQASAPEVAAGDASDVPNAVDAGEQDGSLVGALTSPLPLALVLLGLALAGVGFVARRRVS